MDRDKIKDMYNEEMGLFKKAEKQHRANLESISIMMAHTAKYPIGSVVKIVSARRKGQKRIITYIYGKPNYKKYDICYAVAKIKKDGRPYKTDDGWELRESELELVTD